MKIAPGTKPEPSSAGDPESLGEAEKEPWVRCVLCDGRIARDAARMSVNGSHVHDFMNPAGLRFQVMCFSAAQGCVGDGERSSVWTWFPGFEWEAEMCRTCGAHLGWSFHNAAPQTFYGLIADRLK